MAGGLAFVFSAQPAKADGAAAWRKLAERALGQGTGGSVKLRPGVIDASLGLPTPPRAWTVVGTISRINTTGLPGGSTTISDVYFDSPTISAEVLEAWTASFRASGWVSQSSPGEQGGFVGNAPRFLAFCRNGTVAMIRSEVQRTPPAIIATVIAAVGSPASCSPKLVPPVAMPNASILPRLTVAESVIVVSQNGSSSSPFSSTSEMMVETPKSVAELNSFIGAQMKSDGWTSKESASAPTLISTRWSKRIDGNDATAYLLVSTSPGANRRLLSITAWRYSATSGLTFTGTSPVTIAAAIQAPPIAITVPPPRPSTTVRG